MTHKLVAYWNTGNRYTASGQRITAALTQDNQIIFKDHDRGICGAVASTTPPVFDLAGFDLIKEITRAYLTSYDYIYDVTGQADKLELCSIDPMHGGGPGKPGKVVKIEKQYLNYRVWLLTDTRKFSRTWEAVTPKLTEFQAIAVKNIFDEAYPDKQHVVGIKEPR